MLEPALIYEKRGEEGFALETKNAQLVLTTEDAKEGPRAFMEKRKPHYIGR